MLPQEASTTVLIIPLILNALSAPPPPQTWAPRPSSRMASAPEIVYQIDEQPQHHDPSSSDPLSGGHHPSWLPPMDMCSVHFGTANTTDSSVLLLLMVSLPSLKHQPERHYHYGGNNNNKTKWSNRTTAPWTSLPLEPGIYGVPPVSEEPVRSDPFGLNISLDVGLFSLSDRSVLLMPPMIDIEHRQIFSDYPASGAPALFGFVLCRSDDNGSFIPSTSSIFQDGRRYYYTREVLSGYRESVRPAAQPRKLLGAHGTNLHGLHRQGRVCKKHVVSVTAAGIIVGFALLALVCSVAGFLYWCTHMLLLQDERPHIPSAQFCHSGPRRYSHRELAAATCGFSDEGRIGRGGFGPVYRGYLRDQDRHVAVKVPHQESSSQEQDQEHEQGTREFQAEVKVMTSLRHRNIVQLLGWCDAPAPGGGLMLVYEFVPNGSLDKHLYDPHHQSLLPWSDRYKVALGVGSAILYLHTECEQCVLHGDIKPANILLDVSCNAKLGDFGLARLVDHGSDSHTTQVVAGTPGYMDPELVNNQRPSVASDIYSFGVLLLEIACGRRPTSRGPNGTTPALLNWVRDMYRENSVLGVADGRLDGEFDDQQMKRVLVVGLWCAHQDQSQRPSIENAMDFLRRQDDELPVLDLAMHGRRPDAVRSLEEITYRDLSAEDSAFENSTTETVYHSSEDSTAMHLIYSHV